MIRDTLLILFVLLFPSITIYAARRYKLFKLISPVVLCYLTGLLIANLSFIPVNSSLFKTVAGIVVPLAIPLLLFSTYFVRWLRYAKSAVLSFMLCVISVIISSIVAICFFTDFPEESWKLAGMMVGVYTGGTPNMSAIGLSINVKEETFILLNAADVVLSGIYLIFLITVAQRLLLKFLP
ncbi:unnamed protein product, partial [marine sediment metagenome]